MSRRKLVAAALFLVGLVLAWYLSRAVAWKIQGFNRDQALANPDCDDCELTATLDALPFIALGLVIYVVVAGAIAWRAFRRHTPTDNGGRADTRESPEH